ncbi:ATP-grasp domain-containing protein [Methylotuvimicrobium buryatense]|uniref:ATP-grasp domain-containing protein n=1 Tax=Methylotuvimicrobium buryatense TaxID=95641 RepID=A0A4P9UL49_METBY|nr:ATP-grasp domain-containing protein [Methylotuvimicrobium buryatense]QCW81979.1 ATP-grasp domain-containing protein [Methylotuvimicrobium buryatense]
MKKALILGIGSAQVDAIQYLKKHGWWVIGCSYRKEGPGLDLIDHFELINITDVNSIQQLVNKEGIDLVYSVGSDLAMPSVAEISDRLGLPSFVRPGTAKLLQSKTELRGFLSKNNISPVNYRVIKDATDIQGWDFYPAMLKPTDSQGQRGISRVESYEDITNNLDSALNASRTGIAILEEVLEGPEVSVNAFVVDGQVVLSEVSDRWVLSGYPGGIPQAHILPTQKATNILIKETKNLVKQCIHALDIKNGPVYFQIILTSQGPRIVEITPRLDGCHMWRLIKEVTGYDLLDASFRLLTGKPIKPFVGYEEFSVSSLVFLYQAPNTEFLKNNHHLPSDVLYKEYYFQEGQRVPAINGQMEKVGYYIKRGLP